LPGYTVGHSYDCSGVFLCIVFLSDLGNVLLETFLSLEVSSDCSSFSKLGVASVVEDPAEWSL